MTQREKVLALAVGGLVIIVGLFFGWQSILAGFEEKEATITALIKKKDSNQDTITQGILARKRLNELALRSLPSDLEKAKHIYSSWLIEFAGKFKITNPKADPGQEILTDKSYNELKYNLSCDTRLDEAIKILYAFYEFPYLHKITSLKISPKEKEYGIVTMQIGISVAVLKDANKTQARPDPKAYRLMERPLDDYVNTIIGRNLFYPQNTPPSWPKTASTNATKGNELSHDLSAKDLDPNQKVTYEILESTAEGARIRNDKLVWSPKANGEFTVTVRANDSGLPSESSDQKIAIKVSDPPKKEKKAEEPKFDVATQTRVTALVSGREGPEAWFVSRTEGKKVSVHVGDKFELAGISGTVTAIGSTYVEIETEGRRWTIGQDETLADAYKRGLVD